VHGGIIDILGTGYFPLFFSVLWSLLVSTSCLLASGSCFLFAAFAAFALQYLVLDSHFFLLLSLVLIPAYFFITCIGFLKSSVRYLFCIFLTITSLPQRWTLLFSILFSWVTNHPLCKRYPN
jgi:hypothetical protein